MIDQTNDMNEPWVKVKLATSLRGAQSKPLKPQNKTARYYYTTSSPSTCWELGALSSINAICFNGNSRPHRKVNSYR